MEDGLMTDENNDVMPLATISPYFKWSDGVFTIAGVPIADIMRAAGPGPAFVYDAATMRHAYRALREALPANVEILYAMKANPNLAVVQLLRSLGAGIDTASLGELLVCEKAGVPAGAIAYTAPVKTEQELNKATELGVYINIESLPEAKALSAIASRLGKKVQAGLRINPAFSVEGAHLTLSGGASSKFGIDAKAVLDIYKEIARLPNLQITGIHIAIASGVLSADALLDYYEHCFALAELFSKHFAIERIDLGGGLGIPYTAAERPLDMRKLGAGLQRIIERHPDLQNARVLIEPGRCIVGPAGIYVCRVDHSKTSMGKELLMVDGGVHHYSRPALIGRPNPTINLSRQGRRKVYDIADETATSVGYFGKGLRLAATRAGDFLGIGNAGSYGLTQSTALFISHGVPPEVMIVDGAAVVVRDAVSPAALLAGQHGLQL
jgi:diaminopimelate decarboxylase